MKRAACMGRLAQASAVIALAVCAIDCGLLLNWNDYTGGDAGAGDDAGPTLGEGAPIAGCGIDQRCVSPPGSNWQGPVELYAGPLADPLPQCGPGYAPTPIFEGRGGLLAAASSCSPCECSAPAGGLCAPSTVTFYSDMTCSTACGGDAGSPLTNACSVTAGCSAFQATSATPSGVGACTPSGGIATFDAAVAWSQAVRACLASGAKAAACGSGELCVQSPASPFPPRLCVMQAGDIATCPGSPYADRLTYSSANVIDTRGCATCSCASATGASCAFPSQPPLPGFRYLDPNCTTPTIPFNVPAGCATIAGAAGLRLVSSAVLDAGSCAPSGGQPLGTVAPSAIVTFCCAP